jgi:RAQPRD family integrative conjugative element protein
LNTIRRVALSVLLVFSIAIGSSATNVAVADPQGERTELVRLISELDRLESLIAQAEAGAVTTQRVRFQYPWLRADLEKVKAGIREYLDSVPVTPHVPPPLAGDYIR